MINKKKRFLTIEKPDLFFICFKRMKKKNSKKRVLLIIKIYAT